MRHLSPLLPLTLVLIAALSLAPLAANATLEDGIDGERDRNLVRLVSLLRALERSGALQGALSDSVSLLDVSSDSARVRSGLRSLLPDVVRSGALRERTSPRPVALRAPRVRPDRARPNTPARLSWGMLMAQGVAPLPNTRDLWLDVQIDDARQDDVDGFDGFESSARGLSLGVGFELSDRWHLGFSVGTHVADVETEIFGDDEIDLDDIGVTLSYSHDRHSVQFGYARSFSETDRERFVIVETSGGRRLFPLNASIDADQDMFAIGYSAFFSGSERFSWSPFVDLGVSRLTTDDYVERGGSVALAVETDDATHVVGGVGVNLSWYGQRGAWTVSPELTLAFEHDFKAEATETLSRFRNTALTFVTEGYGIEENRWRYGAGLAFFYRDDLGLNLRYEGQRKGDYRYDGASVSVQLRF